MSQPQSKQKTERSAALFEQARRVIPGGVDSPVRAFGGVGGTPRFVARGQGAYLFDADGNRYIDHVSSWGPLILGHADPRVVEAIRAAAANGSSFGAPTEMETKLAEAVCGFFPSIEKVRFVSSGTEATMSALRLARAATGRDLVIKARGGYHGHVDSLLVQAGSGATTLGVPSTPGVPAAVAGTTVLVNYNDLPGVEAVLKAHAGQVAAIIVEPVAGNMGVILPAKGYLAGLRRLCDTHGTLLILDEVITGFRVALGGAQELYGVRADLTCLGKIIGGGLPVGAYGGPAKLMDQLAPDGPVYQAGTLSGNPLAMAAGLATVNALKAPGVYPRLEMLGRRLGEGLVAAAAAAGVPFTLNRVGSMMTGFFNAKPVTDYATATAGDAKMYARYFHAMLGRGVYLAPSAYEAMFVCTAHTDADIEATVFAAGESMKDAAKG
ncbi:MAG: Glutamate-1-semialdehyde 2,1-aminomutase [Phycisphaerae bacterium]|nr:Glutamate-1-semialdehyde 2,1-aminomutase [Phycisphaerae bacterium]